MDISVNKIYEQLKREIINLDLTPGMKLREEDLAKRFNISRTPIRSVIARLESEDLVVVIPQKGTYVTKINTGIVTDFIYIRKTIEIAVIHEIIFSIDEEQIDILNGILQEQRRIIDLPYSIERSKMFFHNDNLFHKTIFSFARKEGIWGQIHTHATTLNRVRIMSNLRQQNHVERIYEQHCGLVECLKNHDFEGAKEIFVSHIDGGFEGITAVKEKYSDYFI